MTKPIFQRRRETVSSWSSEVTLQRGESTEWEELQLTLSIRPEAITLFKTVT